MAFWLPLAMAAASAFQQKQQADDAQQTQKANNMLAAQKERTAYITGSRGNASFNAPSSYTAMLNGAMQGGMAGMQMNQQMGQPSTQVGNSGALTMNMTSPGKYQFMA